MHHLNKLRLNAGLTMDLALETQQASEENKLTEARETPKRRSELTGKDKKSLKSQERGVKRAMEHVKQAIADRKSTRLNSSHQITSYAVFCLKKKIYGTSGR